MIKNSSILKEFEDSLIRSDVKPSYSLSLKIFESLWNEGVKLGALPLKNPMEGIEVDIEIARILNSCLKKFSQE